MQISDEAVEAALIAFAEAPYESPTSVAQVNLNNRAQMTIALEAAAPHMLAPLVADLDKWAGRSKSGFYDEAQDNVVQILNPYRSQL